MNIHQKVVKGSFGAMKKLLRIFGIWMFLVFAWSNLSFAEVMVEDASGKSIGTYATIQAGIDVCPAGGKVSVSSGTYNEALLVKKGITLIGAGDTQTIISAQGLNNKNTVTFVGAETVGAIIKGFKITGAKGPGFVGGNKPGVNYGNGILCNDGAKPTITDITVTGNSPIIINNTISGNSKDGVVCVHSSPSIFNNIISKNGKAGVMLDFSSSPSIYNNTISWNSEDGIYCTNASSPTIFNNIITKNGATSTDYYGIFNDPEHPGKQNINYNGVWGNGVTGKNNYTNCAPGANAISADPQFVGPENFHLKTTSPCINKGTNSLPTILPTTDKDGNPRIVGIVDMGAYELQENPTALQDTSRDKATSKKGKK
jgi:parallel beta-helix repeat protein